MHYLQGDSYITGNLYKVSVNNILPRYKFNTSGYSKYPTHSPFGGGGQKYSYKKSILWQKLISNPMTKMIKVFRKNREYFSYINNDKLPV